MLILDLLGKLYTHCYNCFFGPACSRFSLAEVEVKGKDERAKPRMFKRARQVKVGSLLERPALILTSLPFYGLPRRSAFPNSKGLQINSFSRAEQQKREYQNQLAPTDVITKEIYPGSERASDLQKLAVQAF